MFVTSLLSTKGGVGKTTLAANLGGLCADSGLKVLLIDMDPVQPSLSSYYPMAEEVSGGIFDLIAHNQTDPSKIISRTQIPNLSLILSNDPNNQLINLLLQAPDGRLRLAHLLKSFSDQFDLILIDTQGARSVMLEMVVLASDLTVSPLQPNMLSAREFNRGTLQMLDGLRPYSRLGLNIPPIKVVVNCLDATNDARQIHDAIRVTFADSKEIKVLQSTVPASVVFRQASTSGMSAHRIEYKQPSNRRAPSALKIIRDLAIEIFPQWADRFEAMTESAVEALVKGGTKRAPASWLHSLASTCASAFDCECIAYQARPGDWHFKFIGLGVSPDLASYAYSALHLQLVSARRQHVSQLKRCNPTTKRRRGRIFAEAWIDAVANNVYKFAGRQNAETQQAISAYLSLHHPNVIEKELESTCVKGHDLRSQHQGWMQGSTAALHRGVDQHSPSPARIGRA